MTARCSRRRHAPPLSAGVTPSAVFWPIGPGNAAVFCERPRLSLKADLAKNGREAAFGRVPFRVPSLPQPAQTDAIQSKPARTGDEP